MIAITGVAPKDVIWARGLNTLIGGTLALIAYAVWPTWERTQVDEVMARLFYSALVYFAKVFDSREGNPGLTPVALVPWRREPRLARTNAQASFDRMQGE